MRYPKLCFTALIAASLSLTTACSNDNDDDDQDPVPAPAAVASTTVEVVHASPDAPNVNVIVDGMTLFNDIAYKSGGSVESDAASVSVTVEGILPGGNAPVIGPIDIALPGDQRITVFAVNLAASDDGIEPLVLAEADAQLNAGETRVRVVHAAPEAPMVDVFVTAPGTDITAEAPLGTIEFKGVLGPVTVPSATYQVRVTAAGDPAALVYDAGAVELPDGADLIVAAVANTGAGEAPISLLVVADGTVSEILDVSTDADIRFVHASPDAPAVDVIVNDDFAAPFVEDLAFPNETGYINATAAALNAKIVPANANIPVVIEADLTLVAGLTYSVYAVDVLDQIEALVLVDDPRSIATEARVRIVHGSPAAGAVDIYVMAPMTDIADVSPAFSNVPFKAETGYVALAEGDYDVIVTPAGSKMAAIGPATISVETGGIYTAIARDAEGGGEPLGLILLDDFNAAE